MIDMAENNVLQTGTTPLTIDQLAVAIKNGIDGRRMEDQAAKTMAEHVLHFFGFSERIIDNVLEQEDRDVFYMLEDAGLLTTEREETTLYDGREWRIHYWLFNRNNIKNLMEMDHISEEDHNETMSVYDDIPEGVWSSRIAVEK